MLEIAKRLRHLGYWERTTQGVTADSKWGHTTAVTTAATFSCFCFLGSDVIKNQDYTETNVRKWNLLLPSSLTFVSPGDYFRNIISINGTFIYAGGKISDRIIYDHRAKGIEFIHVILEPN